MRTLLSKITVATSDLGEHAFAEFSLYLSDSTAPTPGGEPQPYRLVARSSLEPADVQPSVMYGATRTELEEVIIEFSRYDNHEEYPSAIDWYEDDGL